MNERRKEGRKEEVDKQADVTERQRNNQMIIKSFPKFRNEQKERELSSDVHACNFRCNVNCFTPNNIILFQKNQSDYTPLPSNTRLAVPFRSNFTRNINSSNPAQRQIC
jgi:hypothetical protein